MSLLHCILRQALLHPTRVATVDDRQTLTYGRLAAGAMFLAEHLEAATAARHVGLLLPTSGAFPLALLGAWLAQRVAVPLNYLLARQELAYVLADSDIDTVITVAPMLEYLGALPEVAGKPIKVLRLEDVDWAGAPPLRWPPLHRAADLALLIYTSGTSGRPKGVMLSHGNLQANVEDSVAHAELTRADTFLGVLPQFHSFGLTAMTLIPLSLGSKVVYTARFVPTKVVQLIRDHRPDIFMAIPSMYAALLSVKDACPEDFQSLRYAISGGEPLPPQVHDEALRRWGLKILEGYGLTETSPVTHWSTHRWNRLRSVGRPLPRVTQLVLGPDGQPLPPGQDGEIVLAGPNIMQGYYKLPQETAQVMVDLDVDLPPGCDVSGVAGGLAKGRRRFRGQAFRTGDIGHVDSDGYLFITGRKKEMLIVGGENVFPREIENVLKQHPSVRDSAVIGLDDGVRGQVPVAFVEMHPGQEADETALRAFCREHLAGYKVPRRIHFIEQLPRTPTGKVLRRELTARLAERGAKPS